jgi:hypothetical protein
MLKIKANHKAHSTQKTAVGTLLTATRLLIVAILLTTATYSLHSAGFTLQAERELYNNYFVGEGIMIIPHHTYSSIEPIFEDYLLCMDGLRNLCFLRIVLIVNLW